MGTVWDLLQLDNQILFCPVFFSSVDNYIQLTQREDEVEEYEES